LAGSAFFENFQIRMWRGTSVSWRWPLGPARLLWWLMPSAVTSLLLRATMEALTGVGVHPGLPCWSDSLLLASVQDSTSGSMQSRKTFLYHSTTSTVCGELMLTVLPSFSTSLAPWVQRTGPAVEIES